MILLDIVGIAGCCLLLVFGVYFASHERHPLDLAVGGALVVAALTGVAMILHIKPTWHLAITLTGFGIVTAHIFGLIPERFYLDHGMKRK